jgi:hypothetical protein
MNLMTEQWDHSKIAAHADVIEIRVKLSPSTNFVSGTTRQTYTFFFYKSGLNPSFTVV